MAESYISLRGGSRTKSEPAEAAQPVSDIPPWIRSVYSSKRILALHQEILDFAEYMKPTAAETAMRTELVDRIRSTVLELWPKAKVEVFGSVRTGMFLPTSDIDIVVIGKWASLPLRTLAKKLEDLNIPKNMKLIESARVPIIKFTDSRSNVDVDISFNAENGPTDSTHVQEYIIAMPAIVPLVLIVKQMLAQRMLNEVFTGGLGSYAIFLTVLSFLQLHPQRGTNLGVLLLEYLELYGKNFNYVNVGISVRDGGSYFSKVDREWDVEGRPHLLSIENPNSPTDDVSRNSFAILQVKQVFEHAYHTLVPLFALRGGPVRPPKTQLGLILCVRPEVVEYRAWVEQNWGGKAGPDESKSEARGAEDHSRKRTR
eukprot:m.10030 g.10030  ORF g.10030 m.10030 type:complete len:371 (+) comp5524_c0_seq1:15-1127(+)